MLDHPNSGTSLDTLKFENLEIYRYNRNLTDVRCWCRQYDLISVADQLEWFDRQHIDSTIKMYEVINGKEDLVGVCGLTDICHINRRAEFSLYIFPEHKLKGYGREALEILFTHGFSNLGLNTIWGETFDGNPARNLFLDIGMMHEGTRNDFYFRNGHFIDAHLYSIGAEDWDVEPTN